MQQLRKVAGDVNAVAFALSRYISFLSRRRWSSFTADAVGLFLENALLRTLVKTSHADSRFAAVRTAKINTHAARANTERDPTEFASTQNSVQHRTHSNEERRRKVVNYVACVTFCICAPVV